MGNCADGYSCAYLSSRSGSSRAVVGSMVDERGRITTRYIVIGHPVDPDYCGDVCPSHTPGEGEISIQLDSGLIKQLYHQVMSNEDRARDLNGTLRKESSGRAPRHH